MIQLIMYQSYLTAGPQVNVILVTHQEDSRLSSNETPVIDTYSKMKQICTFHWLITMFNAKNRLVMGNYITSNAIV